MWDIVTQNIKKCGRRPHNMEKQKIREIVERHVQQFKKELLTTIEELVSGEESGIRSYMDVSEVSQLMNLSKKTIRKYAANDKLPYDKDISGRLRFKKEDVEKFIKNIQSEKYGI